MSSELVFYSYDRLKHHDGKSSKYWIAAEVEYKNQVYSLFNWGRITENFQYRHRDFHFGQTKVTQLPALQHFKRRDAKLASGYTHADLSSGAAVDKNRLIGLIEAELRSKEHNPWDDVPDWEPPTLTNIEILVEECLNAPLVEDVLIQRVWIASKVEGARTEYERATAALKLLDAYITNQFTRKEPA